jgi:hypothetical protein
MFVFGAEERQFYLKILSKLTGGSFLSRRMPVFTKNQDLARKQKHYKITTFIYKNTY